MPIIFYSNFGYSEGLHTDDSTRALWRKGLHMLIIVVTQKKIKNEKEKEVGARGTGMEIT